MFLEFFFNQSLIYAMSPISVHTAAPRAFSETSQGKSHFSCGKRLRPQIMMSEFDALFCPHLKQSLVGHLDRRASSSNQQYCDLMSVDFNYFKPSEQATLLTEDELIALAGDIAQSRNSQDIKQFNRQIENACMQSMRAEIVST